MWYKASFLKTLLTFYQDSGFLPLNWVMKNAYQISVDEPEVTEAHGSFGWPKTRFISGSSEYGNKPFGPIKECGISWPDGSLSESQDEFSCMDSDTYLWRSYKVEFRGQRMRLGTAEVNVPLFHCNYRKDVRTSRAGPWRSLYNRSI